MTDIYQSPLSAGPNILLVIIGFIIVSGLISLTVSLVCSSSFVLSSLIPLIGSSLIDFCLFKLLLLFNIKINILIKS